MVRKVSLRTWLSVGTVVLLVAVLYFSRNEILQAWGLMGQLNVWFLLLTIVPLQLLSYYATGETMFAYLRSQQIEKNIKRTSLARLSLEMNFVNHTFPSAGVSGMSYIAWRMKHMGVPYAESTTAQLVRLFAISGGFIIILLLAVIWMVLDGSLNRLVTFTTAILVFAMFFSVAVVIYALHKEERVVKIANLLSKMTNGLVYFATFGKKVNYFSQASFERFLVNVGAGYHRVRSNKKTLIKPLLWGMVFSICEIGMFYVAFVALGEPINPAPLAIAHALASVAGLVMITPGGAGLYEAIMVGFLSVVGIDPTIGIAGIVLARVILIGGAIVIGYPFYQQAIFKYGSRPKTAVTKL